MRNSTRITLLIVFMTLSVITVTSISNYVLFRIAMKNQQTRLFESARSWARIIEAYAEEETAKGVAPARSREKMLFLLENAQEHFKGFGKTGEFTLGTREGNAIVFLLARRHHDNSLPGSIPYDGTNGEPMRRALSSKRGGTLIGKDYRGVTVLAAYEPVQFGGMGIVAKIDLDEVKAPYTRASMITGALALALIGCGSLLIAFTGRVFIRQLASNNRELLSEIEARLRVEDSLRTANRDLEQTNEELTVTLEEMEQSNEELARSQDELEENYRLLRESEQFNREIMSNLNEGVVVYDREYRCRHWNRFVEELMDTPAEAVIGRLAFDCFPRLRELGIDRLLRQVLEGGLPETVEFPYRVASTGREGWLIATYGPHRDTRGNIIGVLGVIRDATEERNSRECIKQSLDEKETLLRELYHRTKNNMQVICGLLHLQALEIDDPTMRGMLQETENRIMSMSLVHQKLYRSQNLSRIGFAGYLHDLAANIAASFNAAGDRVSVRLDIQEVALSIDIAIPAGLVLNELISNSFKHAFPGERRGTISITLKRDGEGMISIGYADDGIGTPEGFDFRKVKSLGSKLLFKIVEDQLGGTIAFAARGGLSCDIGFPERRGRERI